MNNRKGDVSALLEKRPSILQYACVPTREQQSIVARQRRNERGGEGKKEGADVCFAGLSENGIRRVAPPSREGQRDGECPAESELKSQPCRARRFPPFRFPPNPHFKGHHHIRSARSFPADDPAADECPDEEKPLICNISCTATLGGCGTGNFRCDPSDRDMMSLIRRPEDGGVGIDDDADELP